MDWELAPLLRILRCQEAIRCYQVTVVTFSRDIISDGEGMTFVDIESDGDVDLLYSSTTTSTTLWLNNNNVYTRVTNYTGTGES